MYLLSRGGVGVGVGVVLDLQSEGYVPLSFFPGTPFHEWFSWYQTLFHDIFPIWDSLSWHLTIGYWNTLTFWQWRPSFTRRRTAATHFHEWLHSRWHSRKLNMENPPVCPYGGTSGVLFGLVIWGNVYRTKLSRTKVPKIWLRYENFVRRKFLSDENVFPTKIFVRRKFFPTKILSE